MKMIYTISRIFTGLIFVFSGFVKAIDPIGSAIKLEEYFEVFHLDFLVFATLPLGIILSTIELVIGFNLILFIQVRITRWLLLVFMSFFTILTFILALTNPVSDCGCFGDAVKLTNWETFWKNIVIMVPTLIIFFRKGYVNDFLKPSSEWIATVFGSVAAVMLSLYCIIHLPLIDFRAYRTGTNIPDNMVIPEGAPVDEYETILIYEKNGMPKEFTTTDYPWDDSTWTWIDTQHKLVKKGYTPPIYDFSITMSDGTDITEDVLANPDYTLMYIAPELDRANEKGLELANEIARRCAVLDIHFIFLTSSPDNLIESIGSKYYPEYEFHTADETTLKTIIRANPGILLLHNGTIAGKWNFRDIPDLNEIKRKNDELALTRQRQQKELLHVLTAILGISLVYGTFLLLFRKK